LADIFTNENHYLREPASPKVCTHTKATTREEEEMKKLVLETNLKKELPFNRLINDSLLSTSA
jgi:hypothetical protein